jgi:hypothetical protein
MARYLDYADTYLPGETYSAGLEDYQLLPQARLDYRNKKKFKFTPSSDNRPPVPDAGESFQAFLALQNNPERLFVGTARMPQMPFGNFSTFLQGS